MLPEDLPADLPSFVARFGSDEQCRDDLFRQRWPDGFRCRACGRKTVVAGAVESGRGTRRGRRLGRLRLAALPDASRASLEGFLAHHVARPAAVTTDGWTGYGGLAGQGWQHEAITLSTSWGDAAVRLPAIHLVPRVEPTAVPQGSHTRTN
jgi:hypothetical protein